MTANWLRGVKTSPVPPKCFDHSLRKWKLLVVRLPIRCPWQVFEDLPRRSVLAFIHVKTAIGMDSKADVSNLIAATFRALSFHPENSAAFAKPTHVNRPFILINLVATTHAQIRHLLDQKAIRHPEGNDAFKAARMVDSGAKLKYGLGQVGLLCWMRILLFQCRSDPQFARGEIEPFMGRNFTSLI